MLFKRSLIEYLKYILQILNSSYSTVCFCCLNQFIMTDEIALKNEREKILITNKLFFINKYQQTKVKIKLFLFN